ncbi:DUF2180 family protein [Streptomyces sp. NPDC101227]|uniref:DUF2180 family protein n=1 Tax=Streptomyces sp. NPDC101227 TaxID=3366136 RepID=UPI0037F43EE1
MKCYDCALADKAVEAVGSCHHCGAGVCLQHCHATLEPGHRLAGVGQTTLPRLAREITCLTCHFAQSPAYPAETKRARDRAAT